MQTTEVNLPFIANDANGPRHLNLSIDRETLENLVEGILQQTLGCVDACLMDAGLTVEDVDHVVLVGGQTRMPLVQKMVTDHFGKRPNRGVNRAAPRRDAALIGYRHIRRTFRQVDSAQLDRSGDEIA
jgi:molecular chaperone DnaK